VLAHFNNECQYCGSKINLGIHHIDGNPHNDNPENLTLLCLKCNRKAEKDLNIKIGLILHQLSVGQTRREIAQYLRFTKQALHYYFKRMEKESFIERVGKKESRSGYVLKPKGQVVLDKLQSRRQHQI
jgi:DNA-binding MarR family transcriptional regulator